MCILQRVFNCGICALNKRIGSSVDLILCPFPWAYTSSRRYKAKRGRRQRLLWVQTHLYSSTTRQTRVSRDLSAPNDKYSRSESLRLTRIRWRFDNPSQHIFIIILKCIYLETAIYVEFVQMILCSLADSSILCVPSRRYYHRGGSELRHVMAYVNKNDFWRIIAVYITFIKTSSLRHNNLIPKGGEYTHTSSVLRKVHCF